MNMKKYMVQSKNGSIWHYEYFETENEALEYIDCITESMDIALYRRLRDGGYRLVKKLNKPQNPIK